jgi:hypothetical protein
MEFFHPNETMSGFSYYLFQDFDSTAAFIHDTIFSKPHFVICNFNRQPNLGFPWYLVDQTHISAQHDSQATQDGFFKASEVSWRKKGLEETDGQREKALGGLLIGIGQQLQIIFR